MKRLFTFMLVSAVSIVGFAAEYLVSPNATTAGEVIEYKNRTFSVGTTAFATFGELLAVAEANSTVFVDGGTYNEAVTISTAGLTFLGNNAYCETRSSNRSAEESKLTNVITIAANNITFNGFTVTGNGKMYEWNARKGNPITGFKFIYNVVTGSTVPKTNTETAVLQFGHYAGDTEAKDAQWYQRYKDFTVSHNTFTGSATYKANFVSISGAYGTTNIVDNTFNDGGTSIYLNNGQGTINVKNNSFTNVGDTARLSHDSNYGEFCIAMRYCGTENSSNIYIQNNVFSNCQGQSSMYCLIRFFNGDSSNAIIPIVKTKLYANYNIFKGKKNHSSRTYNYVYYSNDEYTGKGFVVDCRFNEYDNSENCFGTVYLPGETKAGRVFGSSMGLFDHAKSAGTTFDYFASPCGTTIKSQTMISDRVCQSFDIDEETGDMYFIQIHPGNGAVGEEPQTVTRYYKKSDGSTGKQYMYLGNAAHGSNIAVCRIDGTLYLFTGGNSNNNNTSYAICIFPFVSKATANLKNNSFTYNSKTYQIKKMTSGNGRSNPYPSIDKQNRLLCESSRSTNYMYFVIWDLDDAFKNLDNATPLRKIKIAKKTNAFRSDSYPGYDVDEGYMFWPFQGFTISGDYIYQAEGMGEGGIDGYTRVKHDGSYIPIIMMNAYNWRTETWGYRKPVMRSKIIGLSHGEPEGWKMRRDNKGRTNMYLEIATGAAGARKNNVFEFVADVVNGEKYKIPTVTSTASVTSLSINVSETTSASKTMTVSSDYLLGEQNFTLSGLDASCFNVSVSNNNTWGSTWSTKATITITYTPDAHKTQHNAKLRISSPNAKDIIVTLQGNYTPPVPPAIMHYELNGGELPKAAEVPTNDSLWIAFRGAYKTYYNYERTAYTDINQAANYLYGGALHDSLNVKHILLDETSGWKWLGDYVTTITSEQNITLESETDWRWNVHAFFNTNDGQVNDNQKVASADFSSAGKPEAWGSAYQEQYGEAVVLPEVITSTYVLPTPIKEGYNFGGWYWEKDFTGTPVIQLEVGASGTLYAKWNEKPSTPTSLDIIKNRPQESTIKFMENGRIVLLRGNRKYDITGQIIK